MADAHLCPCCGSEWETDCEQHVCIQLFGECIACRFLPAGKGSRSGSLADMDRITARRRELIAASITSVEEDGDTMTIKATLPGAHGVKGMATVNESLTAGVPAFDLMQPCALGPGGNPLATECPRCKNPHHACDRNALGVGVADRESE
jgi:hypothetical protein